MRCRRGRPPRLRLAAALAILAGAGGGASAAPVDWLEIAVDDETVTHSELAAQAAFLVDWQQPTWARGQPLAAAQAAVVRDYVVQAMLLASQARALGIDELSEEELAEVVAALARQRPRLVHTEAQRGWLARHHRNGRLLAQRRWSPAAAGPEARAPDRLHWLGDISPALSAYLAELARGVRLRVRGPTGAMEPARPS